MPGFVNYIFAIISTLAAMVGFAAGLSIWKAHAGIPSNSIAAWLWVLGGFIALIGGVLILKRWRWVAPAYIFAGFILLLSAGLYLPQARRAYDEWQRKEWVYTPDKLLQPTRGPSKSRGLFYVAAHDRLNRSLSKVTICSV